MDGNVGIGIVIVICIILSAFFSCTETAFSTVSEIRLRHKADNGDKRSKKALYICEHFDEALTAILIMNNIVNLGCSSLATILCIEIFGNMGAAISTGATTFLVLTFGEIIPKCFGKENSESIALYTASILRAFMFILTPLVFFFIKIKTLALKIARVQNNDPSVTEDELKYIIESIEEEGVLEEQESEMVQSALEFDEKTVLEVLTPRVDVTAIDIDADFEHNKHIIMTERYSRIPVYKDSIDNIIGILHTRDYLEEFLKGNKPDIKKLLQPAFFIYKTRILAAVLNEFKKKKFHIAIVTDEYGGTLGIVTMEDLLEEIVGDIWDEDEEAEEECIKLSDDEYLVSGDMDIGDLFKLFEINDRNFDKESLTVGGFIAGKFGKIPKGGESFEFEGLTILVENVLEQRILTAIVKKTPKTQNKA